MGSIRGFLLKMQSKKMQFHVMRDSAIKTMKFLFYHVRCGQRAYNKAKKL